MARPSRRRRDLPPRACRARRERQATRWLVTLAPSGRTLALLDFDEALAVAAMMTRRVPVVALWRARFPAAQAPAPWTEAQLDGVARWADPLCLAVLEHLGLRVEDAGGPYRWLDGAVLRAGGARIGAPPGHELVGLLRKAA